jgi:anionic cell wall polymer biosynthesis LytR-Cps2A-Psr (LCP) family protein
MFLKALLDKADSVGTLSNLGNLRTFVSSVADTMTVDKDFSLTDLAWQFHSLRGSDLTFMTSPNDGTGTEDDQSVVLGDDQNAASMYKAMDSDTMSDWVATHGTGQ